MYVFPLQCGASPHLPLPFGTWWAVKCIASVLTLKKLAHLLVHALDEDKNECTADSWMRMIG